MPRQKKKKIVVPKTARKTENKQSRFAWTEKWMQSYSSFLLGIVVVIVLSLFVVSVIRQQSHVQQTSSLSTGPTPTIVASPTPGTTITEGDKTYYVVKSNDSLWTIAETVYNDGYSWEKIATANNLSNPSTIFTGDKLLLPDAPRPSKLGQMMQNTESHVISGNSYTVQQGNTLWDIAVRAYADGYSWTKIANANNLSDPNLIFSGNVLTIPR